MAQKVQVLLTDDIDGTTADETVTFALDGVTYEIDLAAPNAKKLREELAPFVGKARRTSNRTVTPTRRKNSTTRTDPEQTKAIKAWAAENGYQVAERGRISAEVKAAYEAAHQPKEEKKAQEKPAEKK